jgi:hypothetical protein
VGGLPHLLDPAGGQPPRELSGDIPWGVDSFTLADDGRHLVGLQFAALDERGKSTLERFLAAVAE